MKKILFTIVLIVIYTNTFSQQHTISGYVEDANTGEKLINANVFSSQIYKGTVTNNYGFYSLTLQSKKVRLNFSYIGYQTISKEISLTKDTIINILLEQNTELEEVLVVENRSERMLKSSQMSLVEMPIQTVKQLPSFMGETDVLKTLQLMPGVNSGSEGSSGLYVRGGGSDQNLILLDGVPVYNAYHLFGFFSVFNGDAINNIKLFKGGFPAEYGGRTSSILDIRMKEGNNKKIKGEGSIGLIASKFSIEGPIKKDKTSFIVSGRRTYVDVLARPFIEKYADGAVVGYYFYDLNAKINHKFSDKSRLFLSTYVGDDTYYSKLNEDGYDGNLNHYITKSKDRLGWGNFTSSLRWNYVLNNKLFSNTTVTYSNFNFYTEQEHYQETNKTVDEIKDYTSKYSSGIKDLAGKIDFNYIPNPNHYIKFGINHIYHTFKPGVSVSKFNSTQDAIKLDSTYGNSNIYSNELAAYIEDNIKIGQLFKMNIGLRYSGFYVNRKYYSAFEPRASMSFLISEKLSIKASYSQMNQYIHLLTNTTIGLPTDLWLPVTEKIKPQKSIQYAIGSVYNFNKKIDISVEAYYKTMSNLIEYKEGASFYSGFTDWQEKVETGKGTAYGFELLLQKNIGKTTGWIGYTLSWSERKFENLNFGKTFPYRYDRRHDIGIAIVHKFNKKIDAGINWVYGTGNAITLAHSQFEDAFSALNEFFNMGVTNDLLNFETRNSYRMPAYHRLDIGVNLHKQKKYGMRTWSFGLYNAYCRLNAFYLQYDNVNEQMVKFSMFPTIPYVRYSFKF